LICTLYTTLISALLVVNAIFLHSSVLNTINTCTKHVQLIIIQCPENGQCFLPTFLPFDLNRVVLVLSSIYVSKITRLMRIVLLTQL
uniref:Secreted protein n=1 Tax=Pygocentrus nattereri TaxID=42514 RepID=A0AAR2KQT8_PYGNA